MKRYLLPPTGNFYKANLHTHSTVSDGHFTPAEIKERYQELGYSVVAFTDHNNFVAHDELTDEHFLALHGFEWDVTESVTPPVCPRCCHLCLIALDPNNMEAPSFRPGEPRQYDPEYINGLIKTARESGFFVTYNHPVWSQERYPEYIQYEGMNAMEICNYVCRVMGYPEYNSQIYDDMLRAGKRIFCIGADDHHAHWDVDGPYRDYGGAFIVLKAEELNYRAVAKALEQGHFYASQGPQIQELWVEDGHLHLTCAPAQRVDFAYGIRRGESVRAAEGESVTHASCCLPEDAIYVRATVWDEKGRPADTNAYFLDEIL